MPKHKQKFKKINEKKIYFKDIKIQNLKPNIIQHLKKQMEKNITKKDYILTEEGILIFKNNCLKKYKYVSQVKNETNNFVELNEYLKFKEECFQIPLKHKHLTMYEHSFIINDYHLVFEIIEDKINDFYVKTKNSLSILDILMIKEISYIKNLLI
tara:strand:- start:2877 stop:3341 length:465 start_codon:yes stop_codon:yes gene_type:complete